MSISADGKIHTRYVQDLTQTGRLSTVDPTAEYSCSFGTGTSHSQGLCSRVERECTSQFGLFPD